MTSVAVVAVKVVQKVTHLVPRIAIILFSNNNLQNRSLLEKPVEK